MSESVCVRERKREREREREREGGGGMYQYHDHCSIMSELISNSSDDSHNFLMHRYQAVKKIDL